MKVFRVVHSFYKDKSLAKKNFTQVKKKWPEAELVEDNNKDFVIVLFTTDDKVEATKILHKVFATGLWCGIETVK